MKMKYLICIFVILAGLWACDDDDNNDNLPGQRQPHAMRVKKITGYNEHWKDYTLEISYVNNKVVDIKRFSKTGRQVGGLSIRRQSGKVYYELMDYVPAIDADSVLRLDQALQAIHGAGNYTLEDSVPLTSARLMLLTTQSNEGIVSSQQFTYYRPTTDFGTGADFRPSYNVERRETFVIEYGSGNQIQTCRVLEDWMDPDNYQNYTRTGYKLEYEFGGEQVRSCALYEAGQFENNWNRLRELTYNYSGNELVAIAGEGYSLQRNNAGGKLTIVENGVTTSYTLNEWGLPVKAEESTGAVMNIEYESGDGDFEIFTRLDRRQMGFPVIL